MSISFPDVTKLLLRYRRSINMMKICQTSIMCQQMYYYLLQVFIFSNFRWPPDWGPVIL